MVAKTAGTTIKATEVEGDFSSPLIQELRLMVLGTSSASKTKTEYVPYLSTLSTRHSRKEVSDG